MNGSALVVDASVAAKWIFDEVHAPAARRLLVAPERLHAPDFLLLEMDGLLSKRVRLGEISESEADSMRLVCRRSPMSLYPSRDLSDLAFAISVQTRTNYYDCLYLALAVRLKGRLTTADKRFANGIEQGPFRGRVLWVEEIA